VKPVLSRVAKRATPQPLIDRKDRLARLVLMYERLHRQHLGRVPDEPSGRLPQLPPVGRVAKVEAAALGKAQDPFIKTLERTGDVELASVAAFRALMQRGRDGRARTVALALQGHPGTAAAGDACRAMIHLYDRLPEQAWALFRSHDPARMISLAPAEFFRAGFIVAPDDATALLRELQAGETQCILGPRGWLGIAKVAFAAGVEDLSAWALDRAAATTNRKADVTKDVAALREWLGRRERRTELTAERPIAFALLDNESPRVPKSGKRKPDDRQQRVVLRELARRPGTRYDGDVKLARRVNDLVARTDPDRLGDPAAATVWLYRAGRDATVYADVPHGTWLIVVGPLPRPLFGVAANFPFDDRYRPVFASIRLESALSLTPTVLDHLRRFAPVGCADSDTYYLLRAASISAFLAEDSPDSVGALVAGIVAGDDEGAVRRAWHEACAPAVATGISRDAAVAELPPIGFDVAEICRSVRAKSVVIERTEPALTGPEINIEFSLDGNLKHHMVVVLDSIVRRATRPIRLFVLCRDHAPADYERLAKLFPTVSFVWLPTDDVEYGSLSGMIGHITVATMDRLLLPELLEDLDRIIHHDLDTVCLADLAELSDVDLGGHPIGATTSARARYRSGLNEFRGTAYRLRRLGDPELAQELIARSHLRHPLDFDVFNAGVMVFDLARMRADGFCREFFPYAERFGMNDQAVLNAYAGANRKVVDSAWNWCPRLEDIDEPRIAHWSGPFKPWKPAWVRGKELWQAAEELAAIRTASES
jgi:lipopolysaccharide biosynthesis glycosyltransferase